MDNMEKKQIYILESAQEQAELLISKIEEDGYEGQVFSAVKDLAKEFSAVSPALTLMDYPTLLHAEREDVIKLFQSAKDHEIVLYNVPEDASRRLAFYELGARRVYDSSHSLDEIYISLQWLLRAIVEEEKKQLQHSQGSLEDMPLHTLIPLLASEKRSGILMLHAVASSGKIYFYEGNIVDAQTGPFSAENAFYHMLNWNRGTFMFMASKDVKPENKILLSNFGLLIQGSKYKNAFDKQLQALAPLSSVLRIVRSGDLEQSNLDIKPAFLEYLKRPHTLEEVIENPHYFANDTVDKLLLLNGHGFLVFNEHTEKNLENGEDQTAPDIGQLTLKAPAFKKLKENLLLSNQESVKVVILSADNQTRTEIIENIAGNCNLSEGNDSFEVGRISVNNKLHIYLIGIELNQSASESISNILDGLTGFVFIVDGSKTDQFEYFSYVINQILAAKPLPAVVAVSDMPDGKTVEQVREKFFAPEILSWIQMPEQPSELLSAIRPFESEEEEDNDDKIETEVDRDLEEGGEDEE